MVKMGDVALSVVDCGGEGRAALLLHGLAGRATEWVNTAEWLRLTHHVLALDQRGHGQSVHISDVSCDAFVEDAVGTIEALDVAPVLLVGQSMGGVIALRIAARRPDLVRALIVAEATPGRDSSAAGKVTGWLESWPVPFPTLEEARSFFGGDSLYARTWTEVLEQREGGYWPEFDRVVMVRAIASLAQRDYWVEWESIRCPTLIVAGENSDTAREEIEEMVRRNAFARYVEIRGAGHDVHLQKPEVWRETVEDFVRKYAR